VLCASQSAIVGRTHHMLVSCYGSRWRDVHLAMFTAYIDDSGSDPKQAVANATTLIIPAARIVALEREWEGLKLKEGFSEFHTSPFVARNPKSDFANWDTAKHERVFRRVRDICKKYTVQAMSFTVYKKDYDEIVPKSFREDCGTFHYTWAIRQLLSHTEQWRRQHQAPPLEYVFSWMGEKRKNPRRREIEDVMDQAEESAKETGHSGAYEHWSFRRAGDIPGLQCVDALAWCVYQYGLLAYCNKAMSDEALEAWNDFTKCKGGKWGFDVTITRKALKEWVDKEMADGISIRKFAAWKERKGRLA
jgi:hypothetical protein